MISESFAFDGRTEEFETYFDAAPAAPIWIAGKYEISPVADQDFEPAATTLLRHDGRTIGFYAGGMCWIDPEHRGYYLSTPLIVAANIVAGAVPYDTAGGMGFSSAGIAAHEAAHRWTVLRAIEAGLPVPGDVAAAVELTEGQRAPVIR